MKTSELNGDLLDYWVAVGKGWRQVNDFGGACWADAERKTEYVAAWKPSTNWAQGGPIMEREWITVTPQVRSNGPADSYGWAAAIVLYGIFEDDKGRRGAARYYGKTCLEAAMRCYVASKFGDEVPDKP